MGNAKTVICKHDYICVMTLDHTQKRPLLDSLHHRVGCVNTLRFPRVSRSPLPASSVTSPPTACNKPAAAMISLFHPGRIQQHSLPHRNLPCLPLAPDTCFPLPIQTPSVTPGPSELHFYSGRHVRDRVRLHLRRVTENNNTENEGDETELTGTIENGRVAYGTCRKIYGFYRAGSELWRK
ncbi:hypothetical protein AAFF_G00007640 [Aldrovandia affinis]|uniref:Uncharacterized protein n=1 Tax=Aldrovandia affinis TaxID=143900 RepID=A0AAD7T669_9TELE|nr:hypothetical protein AAFF_G00007640 [Aldrovandia affinis]